MSTDPQVSTLAAFNAASPEAAGREAAGHVATMAKLALFQQGQFAVLWL